MSSPLTSTPSIQAYYTTMDNMARNLSHALSICQTTNTSSLVVKQLFTDFSRISDSISVTYVQLAQPQLPISIHPPLPISVQAPAHPTSSTPQSELDADAVLQQAIDRAMSADADSCLGSTNSNASDEVPDLEDFGEDMPEIDEEDDGSDTSYEVDLDAMPEGQRLNYLNTKGMADAIRKAQLQDKSKEAQEMRNALNQA